MTTDKTIKSKYQPKQTNVTWVDLSGETPVEKHFINGRWVATSSEGSGGTTDYSRLNNKPSINGVSLNGNKTAEQLNVVSYDNQSATDIQRNTALANVSNQTANATTGKIGYKVLDPTKTFAEQVTAENTIYEIRDVFDLNGGNITIPTNCILKFNGGKISNGKVDFNSCCIEGENCFGNALLPTYNSKLTQDIKPEWFGAVGNNIDDDTIPWENCLLFAKEVYNSNRGTLEDPYDMKFRRNDRGFPTIHGNTTSRYKIITSLLIDFQCNIKGEFYFCYYGNYPTENKGIINFYGTFSQCIYEFGIIHEKLSPSQATAFYPNWSTNKSIGICFGSPEHPSIVEFCHFKIRVHKFFVGIKLYGHNGSHYCSNITFRNCEFHTCMYGILNYSNNDGTSSAWNNCFKFYDCEFRPTGSGYTLPSDFTIGAFVKCEGNGSLMNTSVIDGIFLEGRLLNGIGQCLLLVDNDKSDMLHGLKISNVRTENINSCEIESTRVVFNKCICDNCWREDIANLTVRINGFVFDSTYIDIPGFEVVNNNIVNKIIELDFSKLQKGSYGNKDYYYVTESNVAIESIYPNTNLGMSLKRTKTQGLVPCYVIKIKPNQVIYIKEKNSINDIINNIIPVVISLFNLDGTPANFGDGVYFINSRYYNKNTTNRITQDKSNTPKTLYVYNKTSNQYYISFWVAIEKGLMEIYSSQTLEMYNGDYYRKNGETDERPILDKLDIGVKYHDNTIDKDLTWNGVEWVFSNGYTSEKNSGSTLERPNLSLSDNYFEYYDTDIKKHIISTIVKNNVYTHNMAYSTHPTNSKIFINNLLQADKIYRFSVERDVNVDFYLAKDTTEDEEKLKLIVSTSNQKMEYTKKFSEDELSDYPKIFIKNNFGGSVVVNIDELITTWTDFQGYTPNISKGDTSLRPNNLTSNDAGFEYYDTNLGKKIMWNGTGWVNLDGTQLS